MAHIYDRLQRNETNTQIKWQHTDMLGRLDAVVEADPLGLVLDMETQTKYDALDRTVNVIRDYTRPNKVMSAITYDGLGRKSAMSDPDMGSWQYFYDPAGNLTEQRDALYLAGGHPEHDLFFTNDGMNRVSGKFYGAMHPTSGVPDVKYYYDNDLNDADGANGAHSWGRLRAAEVSLQWQPSAANAHNYAYDTRGLLVSDVLTTTNTYSSRAYALNYSYDAGGRPHTLTYPNPEGEQVTLGYNGQGGGLPARLTSSVTGTGFPSPVDSAAYNERGQLISLAQGAIPQQNMLTTDFTYDETTTKRGWLTEVRASAVGSALLDLHQHHTLNGNVDSVSQDAPNAGPNNPQFTNTFNYDTFDRLRTAASSSPNIGSLFPTQIDTFDTLSRLTSRTLNGTAYSYAYNAAGHVDAPSTYDLGPNNYLYDANGSQVERRGGSLPQTRSFDAENRLVSVVQTPRDFSPATTSSFVYDAKGVRLIQSVTGGSGISVRTLYIGKFYEETLTGGTNPPYIVYYSLGGKAVGLRRANQPAGNGQYRLVGDQLGSTTLLVDTSSSPQVVQRQYYKPYGESAFQYTSNSSLTTQNFTGQRLDSGSGLLYYGARYYDPGLSYFISADPTSPDPMTGQAADWNRYLYVRGNPLRFIDPIGLSPEDYYIFAEGCVPGSVGSGTGCGHADWGQYMSELFNLYEEWTHSNGDSKAYARFLIWSHTHVFNVIATDPQSGADQIENIVSRLQGRGGRINLFGHSMGGAAVLAYLDRMRAYEERAATNYGPIPDTNLAHRRGLEGNINSAVVVDAAQVGLGTDFGAWAQRRGIRIFDVDTPLDWVHHQAIPGIDPHSGNYAGADRPPVSTDLEDAQYGVWALNGRRWDWHIYTSSHMASDTQTFIDSAWP